MISKSKRERLLKSNNHVANQVFQRAPVPSHIEDFTCLDDTVIGLMMLSTMFDVSKQIPQQNPQVDTRQTQMLV